MVNKILIAGGGQLGSRYLQGLSKYKSTLEIYVFDISEESLNLCKKRWLETNPLAIHSVQYINNLNFLPAKIDLAIISTTADVRSELVLEIKSKIEVSKWLLEKILAQSINDLNKLKSAFSNDKFVWVNTPMLIWPLYKLVRDASKKNIPIKAQFRGFRGLICNAIHYIDLINRWNNSQIIYVDTRKLNKKWYNSKRKNFIENDGEIKIKYEDGSTLLLSSYSNQLNYTAKLEIGDKEWDINEKKSSATNNIGEIINGRVLAQSEMTASLVESIFNNCEIQLPTFSESYLQHKYLLESLILHRNSYLKVNSDLINIT